MWWYRWVHEVLAAGLLTVGGAAAVIAGDGGTRAAGLAALVAGLALGVLLLVRAGRRAVRG